MKEGCKGPDIHGHGAPPQLVGSDPGQFVHDHPYHLRPCRHFHLHPFFYAKRTRVIVNMGRQIIHPAGHVDELTVAEALAHLFNGAVDIAQVRLHFLYRFAVEGDHQVQYAMGGRMLWSYIDDQITLSGCAYLFKHKF